jgi:hypothetical protein
MDVLEKLTTDTRVYVSHNRALFFADGQAAIKDSPPPSLLQRREKGETELVVYRVLSLNETSDNLDEIGNNIGQKINDDSNQHESPNASLAPQGLTMEHR